MAILETEAVQLSNAVRDAMVALRTLVNGNQLTNNLLETTDKTDLVSAVNELKASIDALSYDDLADLPTIPATVAELTDATIYDFPTLNTPVSDALAAKANSADLGSISTFEGDQPLRTTDSPTFAGVTLNGNLLSSRFVITQSSARCSATHPLGWSSSVTEASAIPADTAFSRISAGVIAAGNGTAGNASGSLSLTNLTASGTVTLDGLARPSWTYAPVTDTSTARSLTIAADLWKRLRFSNVGAITITVPENSTQAFPIGYTIPIRRVAGAGAITIAVAGGVTVNGSAGSTSVPAGGDFALHKIATDTWDFI
jgi:hypothetical protein